MFALSCIRKQIVTEGKYLSGPVTFVNGREYREFILADSGYLNCNYLVIPIDLKGCAGGLSKAESYYNYIISRVRVKEEQILVVEKKRLVIFN